MCIYLNVQFHRKNSDNCGLYYLIMKRNVIKLTGLVNKLSKYDFSDQYVKEYILKKPLIVFKCVFYCFVVSMS